MSRPSSHEHVNMEKFKTFKILKLHGSHLSLHGNERKDDAKMRDANAAHSCDNCFEFRQTKWKAVKRDHIKKNHVKFSSAIEALAHEELGQSNTRALQSVTCTADGFLSD